MKKIQMMPDFDYAVVDCMHELLYNRTYFNQNDYALNLSYYANQPNVSFNSVIYKEFRAGLIDYIVTTLHHSLRRLENQNYRT